MSVRSHSLFIIAMRRSVDTVQTAARFYYFAERCRAFARSSPQHAADLLKLAQRWEADARMVELDARIIERSKELLAEVERFVPDGK